MTVLTDEPFTRFKIGKTTTSIGAEIHDLDLTEVDAALFSELHRAFLENQVLVFRVQNITREQQRALSARFGDLHIHPAAPHAGRRSGCFRDSHTQGFKGK